MMDSRDIRIEQSHKSKVEQYYRFHAPIYDATRWSFLFGRNNVLNMIPDLPPNSRILEIGCGTGHNLQQLQQKYPTADLLGLDVSADMLNIAQKKLRDADHVDLHKAIYGMDRLNYEPFDLILLSYSLTMINGSYDDLLGHISGDLKPEGYIAVVDFHTSPFGWFRRWMNMNHVDFRGILLPQLQRHFQPVNHTINSAYAGLWSYFLFVGRQ